MKPLPFRLKIALFSLLVSGGVLVAFGLAFLAVLYQTGLDRTDRELRRLAEGHLHFRHLPDHWEGFDRSLRFIYGEDAASNLAVQVRDAGGQPHYTSSAFPPALAALRWPELELLPAPDAATLPRGLHLPAQRGSLARRE